jgi:D-alanyl-lipoteichoic acid acyltransferase DltB (MBOAT superfamily)
MYAYDRVSGLFSLEIWFLKSQRKFKREYICFIVYICTLLSFLPYAGVDINTDDISTHAHNQIFGLIIQPRALQLTIRYPRS